VNEKSPSDRRYAIYSEYDAKQRGVQQTVLLSGMAPTKSLNSRIYRFSVWLLCAVLLLALHAKNELDSDEGVILNGAWNLLHGRILYTDFFEFIAPGSFYLIFAVWQLFGAHFWIAKLIGISAIASAVIGTYRISLLVASQEQITVPRWAYFFGPLVYCLMSGYWPAINHNALNIAFMVWSAYFVARSIVRQSLRDACAGGLIAGVAILFLQHRGLVLAASALAALGFFLARDKDVAWLKHIVGFLVGALTLVASMLLFWPGTLLIENLIRFPANHYLEINRLDPSLFLITACGLLLASWLLRNSSNRAVWFLVLLQGAIFLTALQRPDHSHITVTLFPILALFPLVLATSLKLPLVSKSLLFWHAAILLILIFPITLRALIYPSWFVDRSQHLAIQYLKKNCTSSPYIYAGPFRPGLYFETGKLNPTRYSVLLTRFNTSAQFLDAKNDIESHRPQCVVTSYSLVEKFNYDKDNEVDKYIASNYELAYESGRFQIFVVRSSPMPPVAVD
jgi:hypothetical protein